MIKSFFTKIIKKFNKLNLMLIYLYHKIFEFVFQNFCEDRILIIILSALPFRKKYFF